MGLSAQTIYQNLALRKPVSTSTLTFSYTGSVQIFVVPNRVTSIQVNAVGAKGGTGGAGQVGGAGANITTTLNVSPGQILYIVVGGFPGQSATAKYGFGANGGSTNGNFGGAGGGLSGVFTSSLPAIANALVVAGGGGGGAGHSTGTDYTGGNAGNTSSGTSSDGNEPSFAKTNYVKFGRYQTGYAATNSAAGLGGYSFDDYANGNGGDGNGIYGGIGGASGIWGGGGGGGAGYYGGGGGAAGGDANGGGAGGATKSTSGVSTYGTANTTGDGKVVINCLSNSGLVLNFDVGNSNSYAGSGTTITNLVAGGTNGTMSNATYTNPYFSFNGNDSQISIADDASLEPGSGDWTMEAWFDCTTAVGGTTILGKFNFGGRSNDVSYSIRTSGTNVFAQCGDGTGTYINSNSYAFTTNNWYQVVYVWKAGQSKTLQTYINGSSIGTVTHTMSSLLNATTPIYIGRYNGGEYAQSFSGRIGIVRLYKRALSPEEILSNFNASRITYGL